jgi:SAM-dependent methyltransferase
MNASYIPQKMHALHRKLKRAVVKLRAKPKDVAQGIKLVKRFNGLDINTWIDLVDLTLKEKKYSEEFVETIKNHDGIKDDYATLYHYSEIIKNYGAQLKVEADVLSEANYIEVTQKVILEIIKLKTIYQCRDAHTEGGYYDAAEKDMDWQWDNLIYPEIKDFDFTNVLELAPGHGRNTNKLRKLSKEITLVDVNETCINACKSRFGLQVEGCKFNYYVNDGCHLKVVPDNSITTIYSFDSMVHFDKTIVREYMKEFKRILAPNGKGFLHHSNYGSIKPNSDWAKNPGNRSDVSAELFKTYAEEFGLKVANQKLHGLSEGRGIEGLDCVSIIQQSSN